LSGWHTTCAFYYFRHTWPSQTPDVPVPFTIHCRTTHFLVLSCTSRNSKFVPKRVRAISRFLFLFDYCVHLRVARVFISFLVIDPPVVLCGPQLASMLGCWAATKDVKSVGACRDHAQALFECMRTAVRLLSLIVYVSHQETDILIACGQPMKRKQHRPPINYHLARLGKTLRD
jgi:hypothetical protein